MKKTEQTKQQGDWLYFTEKESNVRDIYELLRDRYEMELWEDAGVLEVEIADGSSVDFEEGSIHPKDEITGEFARKHNFVRVFLVTFKAEDYAKAEKLMHLVLEKAGGMFCGDTEDFMPILTA